MVPSTNVRSTKAGSAPTFWRIFAATVVVIICIPVYFLVEVAVRLPIAPSYSLDAVTAALGSGMALRDLDIYTGVPPSLAEQDELDRAMSLALADRLSIPPAAVRIVVEKPPRLIEWKGAHASDELHVGEESVRTVRAVGELPDEVVGDFTAAMLLENHHWRVVRSAAPRAESWELLRYLLWLASPLGSAALIAGIVARYMRQVLRE